MALLETEGLTVTFGGVVAVSDVSLSVEKGSLTGIIGPNGAGKTTFIDAVSGLVRSTGGINFDGKSLAGLRPHRRASAGISRTFQGLELFDEFTIEENLLVSAEAERRWPLVKDVIRPRASRQTQHAVADALERLGVTDLAGARPRELSLGERKIVSIARALAGEARMILLDEPAAGLNSDDSLRLGQTLRELLRSGLTIGLVDHHMGLVLSVCDQIHVLEFGKLIASGPPDEIRQNKRVIEAYLGDEASAVVAEAGAL